MKQAAINALLVTCAGKKDIDKAARQCSADHKLFRRFLQIAVSDNTVRGAKAAWVISTCARDYTPDWLGEEIPVILEALKSEHPSGLTRELFKALEPLDLSEHTHGGLYVDTVLRFLGAAHLPVGIKGNALLQADRIFDRLPAMQPEFIATLERASGSGTELYNKECLRYLRNWRVRTQSGPIKKATRR